MSEEEIPRSALQDLAVFPLPDVVLFPGAVLPLHVFEPRYREMTRDVLDGSRLIAIARLRPGYDDSYEGRPPIFSIAGIGYIIASDELADGRYNLLVRGLGRVSLADELPPEGKSYRRARALPLIDSRSARPEELDALHQQLVAVCDRLASHLSEGAEELRGLVRNDSPLGASADVLSAALVNDPDERQELLEMLDPADRVGKVIDHIAQLLGRIAADADEKPN